MSRPVIGRRIRPEYTPKTGNYNPPLGQIGRGATPNFAIGSAQVGTFDSTSLLFSAATLASGLTVLTAQGYLPNVTTLTVAATDICQTHITNGSYTTPNGIIVSNISFQLKSATMNIAATNILTPGTYGALSVIGVAVVYAPSSIGTPVSFTIPLSVAFLGDVLST